MIAAYRPQRGLGGVYIAQYPAAPVLNIASAGSNYMLSWVLPTRNFVLQQNTDLGSTNWTTLTNSPMLNLSTLNNELPVPSVSASAFYRLAPAN